MREIKFRGKSLDGLWQYGYLVGNDINSLNFKNKYITPSAIYKAEQVATETVGQYTGLKDRDDVDIYEDDIASTVDGNMKIVYMKDCFQCVGADGKNSRLNDYTYSGCIKIIGNIFDNPELI